jgi:hypothetical protein
LIPSFRSASCQFNPIIFISSILPSLLQYALTELPDGGVSSYQCCQSLDKAETVTHNFPQLAIGSLKTTIFFSHCALQNRHLEGQYSVCHSHSYWCAPPPTYTFFFFFVLHSEDSSNMFMSTRLCGIAPWTTTILTLPRRPQTFVLYSHLPCTCISQVQIWRRSFEILPPPMGKDHKYYHHIVNNPKFRLIRDKIPETESLKTTMLRVIPFWSNVIVPDIKSGKRVLVVCHGTSLRGIVKHIDRKLNLRGCSASQRCISPTYTYLLI